MLFYKLSSDEFESLCSQLVQIMYHNQRNCHICKKKFEDKYTTDKNYSKVSDHCQYKGKGKGAAHSICSLKYIIPGEIPVLYKRTSKWFWGTI